MPQLDELIEAYGKDKACLLAAELDVQELQDAKRQIEERLCHAERELKHWQSRVDASRNACTMRIDAQTETALGDEVIRKRCKRALLVVTAAQFNKTGEEGWQ